MRKDERVDQVKMKAYRIGWLSASVVILFLIIWRFIHKEPNSDLIMIIIAHTGATSFYYYAKLPEKKVYLVGGITCIVALGLGIAALLSEYGVY